MLIIAITIHNFPEGMAVGVAFGAIGSTPGATFGSAVSLALGIGIRMHAAARTPPHPMGHPSPPHESSLLPHGSPLLPHGSPHPTENFPEGLAVSMPLMREGVSPLKAFWYGQLSGLVEPIGGVLGAAFVHYCRPMLPFTMSLAAGAMIFVVCDSLVPEMQARDPA